MTNADLDKELLRQLDNRPRTLATIHTHLNRPGPIPSDDVQLGRRLQYLKSKGKIRYLTKPEGGPGWINTNFDRVHYD